MRHDCANMTNGGAGGWTTCIACDGRLHLEGCTTKRDPRKDCCEARHRRLHEQGQTVGLWDSSVPMLGSHREDKARAAGSESTLGVRAALSEIVRRGL